MLPALRRFVVVLLALALFAPGSAFGRVLYACSMSGKVSAGRCCCHQAKAKQTPDQESRPAPTQVERPDCCEARHQHQATVSASHGSAEVQVLAAAPTGLLPAVEPCAAASQVMRRWSHAARGPPHRPKVFAVNCSLLI